MTTTASRRSSRARLAAGVLAAAALGGSTLLATASPASAGNVHGLAPTATGCQVIDFRTATVTPLVSPDPAATTYVLTVSGLLPFPAEVTLDPLVYIRQPEHWGIEVRACKVSAGPVLPANLGVVPLFRIYQATLTFRGPMGSCGIEVIGASARQTFDLAGPKACGEIGPAA